ncbi:MAG: diguanylate cyclase [Dehalococcoidia bacterium]|jgi:diguanylate cyclase (GGDEF)-like protein|nr:diguanylate cyclase [Dehalococcoidia bacterium]
MDTHVVIPFIASVAYLILFAVLLMNRPWEKREKLFIAFIVAAFLYSVADLFVRGDFLMDYKRLLAQIGICMAIWTVVQYHYFIRPYFSRKPVRVPLAYLFVVSTAALCIAGLIPRLTTVTDGGVTVYYGLPLLIIGVLVFTSLGVRDSILLFRCHRLAADAAERNQIAYLITTIVVFSFFMLLSFVPSAGSYPWSLIGNLLAACVLSYAVVAHRLLDIGVFMRRALVLVLLYGGGMVVIAALLAIGQSLFGVRFDVRTVIAAFLVGAPVVLFLNHIVRDVLRRKIEEAFVGNRYEARRQLSEFVERIYDVPTLEQFGRQLVSLMAKAVDARLAYLLLPDVQTGDFVVRFAQPPVSADDGRGRLRIKKESPVLDWLKREGQLLPVRYLSVLPEFQALWKQERDDVRTAQVELFLPVANRGEVVAVLAAGARSGGRPYSVEELELMRVVASRVAASMEKQYLYEQLQKQERELTLLNRIASVVTSSLEMHEVMQRLSLELQKVIPLDFAGVAIVDGDRIKFQALFGDVTAQDLAEMSHSVQGTATEWVMKHRQSTYQADLQAATTYWPDTHYVREGVRALVHLPLIVRDQVIGTLLVASREPQAYREQDVQLLEQVARQIATPVENALLYSKAEQRSRIDELTGLFNRRHFEERIKEEVARHSRHDGVFSVLMLDLDSFKAYNDMYGHPSGDKLLKFVASLVGYAIRDSDQAFRYGGDEFAIVLPRTSPEDAYVVAERVRTRVAREMEARRSGVTASIGLASYPADGVMAGELVATADTALYYAKNTGGNRTYVSSKIFAEAEAGVEPKNTRKGSGLSAVYALAAAVDAKDHYTYGHSRKVNTYSVVLAETIGLPSDEVSRISTAALLHDIGKIGVPDSILNKKGELDAQEWDAIKSHPRLGANIVGNVPDLSPCVGSILYHHERWDGTGYPEGLHGKTIPLGARILAIADAFAAMASARPYRAALPDEEALERLKQGAGNQFDPELVQAFVEEVEAGLPQKDKVSRVPPIQP